MNAPAPTDANDVAPTPGHAGNTKPAETESVAKAPQSGSKRTWLYLLIGILVAAGASFAAYRYWHRPPALTGTSRLSVDLSAPELLLVTRNLANLPKDVAAAPLLSGLVDEQLVFHYEEDEARLSLDGTLRRLAYEHELSLQERFLATLLAAPAEIAMWRSSKGRPEHFVASLERGALGKLTGVLAKIALDDRQLKEVGKFELGGDAVSLYALEYGGGRTLAFAGLGDRWVFLSDPGLALDDAGKLSADGQTILGDLLHGRHPWQESLPHSTDAQHSLVIGQEALTMDYARFVPALQAARLDHDGKSWQASLKVDAKGLPTGEAAGAVWSALPLGAALCAALPVDWQAAAIPLASLLEKHPAVEPLLAALSPIGAVCWYADSRFASPLFVARAGKELPAQTDELLARLAAKSWSAQGEPAPAGKAAGGAQIQVSTVASYHGLPAGKDGSRQFQVALAHQDRLLLFSPDRKLVDAALAVAAKQAPALTDEAGLATAQGPAWLMVDPAKLGQLVRAEVQEVLPADEEAYFREVARNRLWPRLEAWGKQHGAVVALPGGKAGGGFVGLEFRPLRGPAR